MGDCFGDTARDCPHDATAAFAAALGLYPGGPLENRLSRSRGRRGVIQTVPLSKYFIGAADFSREIY